MQNPQSEFQSASERSATEPLSSSSSKGSTATRQPTLSTPHEKFAEALSLGKTKTEAYQAAYPEASIATARSAGSRLSREYAIQDRVIELRNEQRLKIGSAYMNHIEKRIMLARIMRCHSGRPDEDTDLGKKIYANGRDAGISTMAKLAAMREDNIYDPPPAPKKEPTEDDIIADLITSVRCKDHPTRPSQNTPTAAESFSSWVASALSTPPPSSYSSHPSHSSPNAPQSAPEIAPP